MVITQKHITPETLKTFGEVNIFSLNGHTNVYSSYTIKEENSVNKLNFIVNRLTNLLAGHFLAEM